jgi:tetratricopeptide (TPR) repeat protein
MTAKVILTILIAILIADVYLLIKKHNEHAPANEQCRMLVNEGQYASAVEYAKSHANLKSPALFVCMADAYYLKGDIDNALQSYNKAMELQESFWYRYYDPDMDVHIYTRIAEIHEQHGELAKAIEYYRKAAKSMKADRKTIRSAFIEEYRKTLIKISDLYQKVGDQEKAEEYRSCAVRLCKEI